MKLVLCLLVALGVAGCVGTPHGAVVSEEITVPPGDWVRCDRSEARYAVSVDYSIDGVFERHPWIEWIRERPLKVPQEPRGLPDGSEIVELEPLSPVGTAFVDGVTPGGKGWGYNATIELSPARRPPSQDFELHFRIAWDREADRGSYDHTFYLERLSRTSIKYQRLRISLRVDKVQPNQPPVPTPGSAQPDAGATGSGAAHL